MNKTNNKRNQKTHTAIQRAYLSLVLSRSDINTITVSDICKKAGINRTTFYTHFLDITDLIESIYQWMMKEYLGIFEEESRTGTHSMDFHKLFVHIYENQIFYKMYFKLGFDFKTDFAEKGTEGLAVLYYGTDNHIEYHIEFFAAGLTAIIKKWLYGGCKESPEVMAQILASEYQKSNELLV